MDFFRVLPRWAADHLELAAPVLLTPQALGKFSLEEIGFRKRIQNSYSALSLQLRVGVLFGLLGFNLFLLIRYFKCLKKSSFEEKKRVYQWWFYQPTFLLYALLRPLMVLVYTSFYSHPKLAKELGFEEDQNKNPDFFTNNQPPRNNEQPSEIHADFCVLGSGAGGAVVARELALLGHQVVILEEGPFVSIEQFQNLPTIERNRLLYRDGGMFSTMGLPPILLPTGRCVGGTTVINSGTCFRTPADVLSQWQDDYGLKNLTQEKLNPYFERVEAMLQVKPVAPEVFSENDKILQKGAARLGYEGFPLQRNVGACEGKGVCIFGCPTGAKLSMERSYLPSALSNGAKIYSLCKVNRLVVEGSRVIRIEAHWLNPATRKKESSVIIYPKNVIVSCGTLNTPLLLKKSRMARFSKALGRNLTIHPTCKMVGMFDEVVDGFRGVPQGSAITALEKEGVMFESVFFPPWLLAASLYQPPEVLREILFSYRHCAIFGFLVHDQGHGRVVKGWDGNPLVFYSLSKKEVALFQKGLAILGAIFFKAGAKKIYCATRCVHELTSPKQLDVFSKRKWKASDFESAAFHPLGTCRMGQDARNSVVDENLKIHDLDNAYIADGSVFPTSLGVNPQITIMSFATRLADHLHSISFSD
ncbi:MAG TPA: hypothetical protein DDW49_07055 [Deltaproteobacteria bacterium]|nr:MAG: hypothetical protein A2048_10190 [Deltaproteobacteria bacterium GWA2_45_12]HBF13129.1 hypothetical protein [Deltaproteobacteria bacterium]